MFCFILKNRFANGNNEKVAATINEIKIWKKSNSRTFKQILNSSISIVILFFLFFSSFGVVSHEPNRVIYRIFDYLCLIDWPFCEHFVWPMSPKTIINESESQNTRYERFFTGLLNVYEKCAIKLKMSEYKAKNQQ